MGTITIETKFNVGDNVFTVTNWGRKCSCCRRYDEHYIATEATIDRIVYRDWETDRKSTRLNSSHSGESRMPSSA